MNKRIHLFRKIIKQKREKMYKRYLSKIAVFGGGAMIFFECATPGITLNLTEQEFPIMLGSYVGPNKLKLPESATELKKGAKGIIQYTDGNTGDWHITENKVDNKPLADAIHNAENPVVTNLKITAKNYQKMPPLGAANRYVEYKCDVYNVKTEKSENK